MTRDLTQWRSLEDVWSFRHQIVQEFLDGLNFDYLGEISKNIRRVDAKVRTDRFTSGRERVVFEIEFADGTFWVARITFPPFPTAPDDPTLLPSPGPEVTLSEVV